MATGPPPRSPSSSGKAHSQSCRFGEYPNDIYSKTYRQIRSVLTQRHSAEAREKRRRSRKRAPFCFCFSAYLNSEKLTVIDSVTGVIAPPSSSIISSLLTTKSRQVSGTIYRSVLFVESINRKMIKLESDGADAVMADNDDEGGAPIIQTILPSAPSSPSPSNSTAEHDNTDNISVGSGCSSKSEERRRRRENWRREHENQLRLDGTFPRRHSVESDDDDINNTSSRKAVSARVVQHLGTKSTAKPHTLPPAVSDDVRVRSNLLRTLGIQKEGVDKKKLQLGGSTAVTANGKGGGGLPRNLPSIVGGEIQFPGASENTNIMVSNTPSSRSLLSNVRLKEELKYDSDDDLDANSRNSYTRFFGMRQSQQQKQSKSNGTYDNSNTNKSLNETTTTSNKPHKKLVISNDVQVVPIPMRSEYSNRIKERMYSGRVELSENAQRNVVEFEAEGWDATTVLDDEAQFYKCPLTGELIHPVHLAYFNKQVGE